MMPFYHGIPLISSSLMITPALPDLSRVAQSGFGAAPHSILFDLARAFFFFPTFKRDGPCRHAR